MELPELLVRLKIGEDRLVLLEEENERLRKENIRLEKELSKYRVSKNSSNSSVPPSNDVHRSKNNQSLRKASNKPLGGQPGHKGNTLKKIEPPDVVIDLIPDYCQCCGTSLEDVTESLSSTRQQIDLPPIHPVYTQYRSYSKTCGCGKVTTGDFPSWVNAPISYGPTIEGLVGYFHARQYLPFARMQEVFKNLFNIDISQGGIECLLKRFAAKTKPVYQLIKQQISQSKVVGSDETSVNINGKNHWMWTWQTPTLTYITHSANRATITIEEQFPEGFPQSILVSDGWKPQLGTNALHHQSCLAHLLRRLNYLKEKYQEATWALDFQELLYQTIQLKQQYDFNSTIFQQKRIQSILQLQNLLEHPPDKKHKDLYAFYKRMGKERQYLFVFLYIQEVPFDNNASERAIRNIKVKQKISGQFKNQDTAQNFAILRSVIDTAMKNGRNIWEAITIIAKNEFDLSY